MKAHHLIPLFAGLVIAATASAQSIQYFDVVFADMNSPIIADAMKTLALPAFDPNLGTLQSVTLTLNSTLIGYAKVADIGSSAGTFSNAAANFSAPGDNITLAGPAGLTEIAHPVIAGFGGTVAAGSFALSTGVSQSFAAVASDSNLQRYQSAGGGTVSMTLDLSGVGTFSGTQTSTQQVFFGGEATASGDLSVRYGYSPIPEPAAWAAALGGAVLAGTWARRRGLAPS